MMLSGECALMRALALRVGTRALIALDQWKLSIISSPYLGMPKKCGELSDWPQVMSRDDVRPGLSVWGGRISVDTGNPVIL